MFGIKFKAEKQTETKKEAPKSKELPAFPEKEYNQAQKHDIPKANALFSIMELETGEKASKDPLNKIEALNREINALEQDSEALTQKSDLTIEQLRGIIDKQRKIHEALQHLAKRVESAYIKNHWGLETNVMHLDYKIKTAERRAKLPEDIRSYQEGYESGEAPDNSTERQKPK